MDLGIGISGRPWRFRPHDAALALALSQRLGLPEMLGRVLAGRGIGLGDAEAFLSPKLRHWLPDPSHLLDLDKAAARLADAVAAREPIGLIGDYDVDGATATALVARYLRALGVPVSVEIPDRLADGYGPNPAALDRLGAAGCRLIMTLDTGTTAHAALAHAPTHGQEVIVVDHHAAEAQLPPALAVVNPNRLDQESPLGHLAAVGVAFVALVALARELRARGHFRTAPEPDLMALLDLVALGTVCDVVPLHGLNRAFVHQGLKVAASGANLGLVALAREAGLSALSDARQLGFVLGPRINAGGRTGRSSLGARLLMTESPQEAAGLAARLHGLNAERQRLEQEVLAGAWAEAERQLAGDPPLLVVAGPAWHAGVIGIVASRLVERCHRPVLVVAVTAGIGKGSGRSVPGFDLGAAVIAARQAGLLLQGGGHEMAAGLTVAEDALPALHEFLAERCAEATLAGPRGTMPYELDGALTVAGVGLDLLTALERVAPFGAGNLEPAFCLTDAHLLEAKPVGDAHVSCLLGSAAVGRLRAIAFRSLGTPLGQRLLGGGSLRLVGRAKLDRWQDRREPGFTIEDAAAL